MVKDLRSWAERSTLMSTELECCILGVNKDTTGA